jgi:hypothetical protein
MQQSYAPQQPAMQNQLQNSQGIIWVDGEAAAKAYQLMPGQALPVALWDTNDTVIYLKSVNQMGMPNPLQKIHYTMEEQQNQSMLPSNTSGNNMGGGMSGDHSNYVTKDDLESMRREMRELLQKNQQSAAPMQPPMAQNGGNPGQSNRGGNR